MKKPVLLLTLIFLLLAVAGFLVFLSVNNFKISARAKLVRQGGFGFNADQIMVKGLKEN